jgi:HD-GYP domain-containing protein (c-di-GMP phosphodiesterase class II)
LLGTLQSQEDHGTRIAAILEWTVDSLDAEGAALLELGAPPSRTVSVLASYGSLVPAADRIAALWTRNTMPREHGIVALPAGTVSRDCVLALPLDFKSGAPWIALVLHGADIDEKAKDFEGDLLLVSSLLREGVEKERMRRQIEHEKELASVLTGRDGSPPSARLPGLALLADGLGLPLYVCDAQGRFLYASPSFLALTGYPTLTALVDAQGFYVDPKARADELEVARSAGKVSSFPLAVRSGAGVRLEMHDSTVSLGDSFFGVFFDVTALMARNAELKDALQIQELLNDSIIAGTKTLQRTQGAAIRTLARLAEYRDPETGIHLQRICEYTRLLATQVFERAPYSFRITREYGDDISMSSMLHDIGKVSIPDSILLKPGKLDAGEWEEMKKHTVRGWEVLHKADRELGQQSFLTLAATIALCHHEHYDGSGYPHGRTGDQIPLSARISAIADVYDALTSARPYKEAWSHQRAVEEVLGQAGTHFDPVLVDIFRDIHGSFADVRRMFPG